MTAENTGAVTWHGFADPAVIQRNIEAVHRFLHTSGRLPDTTLLARIEAHLQRIADESIILHFEDPEDLVGILRSGRVLSALELNRADDVYREMRLKAEAALFGERESGVPPIIYGILSDGVSPTIASRYGIIRIVLKQDGRQRSTVTRADSLNSLSTQDFDPIRSLVAAVPAESVGIALLPFTPPESILRARVIDELVTRERYFEVQVHGGVTLDDIERIEVSGGTILGRETERWISEKSIRLVRR